MEKPLKVCFPQRMMRECWWYISFVNCSFGKRKRDRGLSCEIVRFYLFSKVRATSLTGRIIQLVKSNPKQNSLQARRGFRTDRRDWQVEALEASQESGQL